MPGSLPRRLAVMGGAYGNVPALEACLRDARLRGAGMRAFLGDAIGCCGHSDAVLDLIQRSFPVLVAGNHEQQAAAGTDSCGCGYSSPEDEAAGCEAFRHAMRGLGPDHRAWLARWPERAFVEMEGGRVLLCHGSPGHTSEFLYECELDDLRLVAWLDRFDVRGFVCTHSGLPWVRRLRGGRFAANCGVVGKPDHDGDPAVHYLMIDLPAGGDAVLDLRRVEYDHETWARQMERAGIPPVFVDPVRTGRWTTGVASLPAAERARWLREGTPPCSAANDANDANGPERLLSVAWPPILGAFRSLGLISTAESDEALRLLDPSFPFCAAIRVADSVHLHVKVDDVEALPHAAIRALGTRGENARPGYVKYPFGGGLNLIFSSIPIAEEDQLPEPRAGKPFVDHFGIDLRRETGVVRAAFEDTPSLARRAGWLHKTQGGLGRPVLCCHSKVQEKSWVYPGDGARWRRPIELAYGPLEIGADANGCDLRPIDPRHPSAAALMACAPAIAGEIAVESFGNLRALRG
jgi:diadenosine tetraphosphatase ApaH/serine/threonine PP2A family protein phosphatase